MKIVICVNSFLPLVGGSEYVVYQIANYLSQWHEVFVITRRIRNRDHRDFKFNVIEYSPGDLRMFDKHLNKINPDLMLVYSDLFDFFRVILTRKNKFRLLVALCGANWCHKLGTFANLLYRQVENKSIEWLICHSTLDRDYKLCSNDVLKPKTVVIPNGIDLDEFDSNSLTRKDLMPGYDGHRWVLNVSNFFPGKGQDHIVDIINHIPELHAQQQKIVYIQIHSEIGYSIGQKLENHHRKYVTMKMDKSVDFKFFKDIAREKVIGFFKQSNVFLFPTEKEVAPIVVLESMAAELPWVSANVGNLKDLSGGKIVQTAKDSKFNCIIDDRAKKLLARAILAVWDDPIIMKAGRENAERLSWNKILPQYRSLIEQ